VRVDKLALVEGTVSKDKRWEKRRVRIPGMLLRSKGSCVALRNPVGSCHDYL
jgi:hypothetical protein